MNHAKHIFSSILFLLLMASCTSVPREIYLNKTSVSGFSKVAVVVSAAEPKVFNSRVEHGSLDLFGLAGFFVEGAADASAAAPIRKQLALSQVRNVLAGSFIEPLKRNRIFPTVTYIAEQAETVNRQLRSTDYDALIKLVVRNLSLRRDLAMADQLRLCVEVQGQMTDRESGKLLWKRQEQVLGEESHSLEYYQTNGLVGLDALLKAAGTRLANDFVYSN